MSMNVYISLIHAGAGMGNERLYSVSYCGTKHLIEEYIDEVVYQLDLWSQSDIEGASFIVIQ